MRHQNLQGYNITQGVYHDIMLLPNNLSELNQYMCDPLNRKGYMCSQCKNGYGPPVTHHSLSCASMCYLCKETWSDLLLYLSINFIPLTVFYFLILVFQVRMTSAPMTCFIMYSQLIVFAFYEECGVKDQYSIINEVKFSNSGTALGRGTKILLTIYGVFNLDFFHFVLPPFCISSQLRPIHVFSLGYISAFYPFSLIFLTWLCVELHGRNFRPIVCLWRPFHGWFVHLRRGWNTKSDLIDVFASFFLLSYCKILYLIILTFDFTETTNQATRGSLTDGLKYRDYALKADIQQYKLYTHFCCCCLFCSYFSPAFHHFSYAFTLFLPHKSILKASLCKMCT